MFNELVLRIEEQLAKGSDFAIAQVIDRIAPSSGKVGDKALILDTGELIGWIGGGCVRGIVIREALEVIRTKRFMRVRISPEGGTKETSNFKEYVMSCQSKGTIEVLIEPMVAQPELIIVGKSNIARKLSLLASDADFKVTVLASDIDPEMFPSAHQVSDRVDFSSIKTTANTYIIVTTQGEDDEESVKKALQSSVRYVGYVASAQKSEDIRAYLMAAGISLERTDDLKSPVGLNINAKSAGEVAISILAEIIEHFRAGSHTESKPASETVSQPDSQPVSKSDPSEAAVASDKFSEEYYINPVCNVPVSKKNPKHVIDYKGERVYFCCDGCKVSFEKNPAQYIK